MLTFTQSMGLWCIVFAFIGAHVYVIDKKIGIKVHAKWRKWTSPLLEPKDAPDRGFIYNRSNKVRWFWAGIIASINFTVMIGAFHEDPRIQIFHFFFITPSTMAGFLMGPLYLRLIQKREKLFEKMDEVESGKINVEQEVKKVANEKLGALGRLVDRVKHFFASLIPSKKRSSPAVTPSSNSKPPEDPEAEAKSARESIKRFTGGN